MKKTFLIITTALALVSCKNDNNTGNPMHHETPFGYNKTGHRWVYDFVYNGNVVDSLVNEITADSNGMYTMVSKDQALTQTNYLFVDGDYLKNYAKGRRPMPYAWANTMQSRAIPGWMTLIKTVYYLR